MSRWKNVVAKLWQLAVPPRAGLEALLVRDLNPVSPFTLALHRGAVVVADLVRERVILLKPPFLVCNLYLLDSTVSGHIRSLGLESYRKATWAIALLAEGAYMTSTIVPTGAGDECNICDSLERAYPGQGDFWTGALADSTTTFLPRLQREYKATLEQVSAAALENFNKGEASLRSMASIARRVKANLLLSYFHQQLASSPRTLPYSIYRKLITASVRNAAGQGRRDDKPPFSDIARLMEESGFPRRSREEWKAKSLPLSALPHHLPLVNTEYLIGQYELLYGPLDSHDPLFTLVWHMKGHQPVFDAQFLQIVEKAYAPTGGAHLRLGADPTFTPREWEALQKELDVFGFGPEGLGVWEKIPEDEVREGYIKVSVPLGVVCKGPVYKSPEAAAAVELGSLPAIERAAEQGAQVIVRLLEAEVEKASTTGVLDQRRPDLVDQVLAARLPEWEKVRVIFKGNDLTRGNSKQGIPKGAIMKFSFAYPSWHDILEKLTPGWKVARFDKKHWFYSVAPYMPEAMRYLVGRVRNPSTGEVIYYRPHRNVMGVTDAPGLGQAAGTLIGLIAEGLAVREDIPLCCTVIQDDCVAKVPTEHTAEATRILADNMLRASSTTCSLEAIPKRRPFQEVQLITGIEVDLKEGVLRLPPEPSYKYLERLKVLRLLLEHADERLRSLVSTTMVSATTGSLGWWALATNQGSARLAPLYPLQASVKHLDRYAPAAVEALKWWERQAAADSLRPQPIVGWKGAGGINVWTSDAGTLGIAAVFGKLATYRRLRKDEEGPRARGDPGSSSFYRELAGVALAATTFGPQFGGTARAPALVVSLCDSASGGDALSKGNIKENGGRWGEVIFQAAEDHCFQFFPLHYPRELNAVADSLAGAESWEEFESMCVTQGLTAIAPAASAFPSEL